MGNRKQVGLMHKVWRKMKEKKKVFKPPLNVVNACLCHQEGGLVCSLN